MPLARGADVNVRDGHGWTPLHHAARRGAEVNVKDYSADTPLHLAVYGCQRDMTELLIATGADVNPRNRRGKTPLDLAQRPDMQALLRTHGAKSGKELEREGK